MSRGRRPGFRSGESVLADNEMEVEAQMLELKQMKEELMLRESQLLRLKSRQQSLENGLMLKGRGRGMGRGLLGMGPDRHSDLGPPPFGMGPQPFGMGPQPFGMGPQPFGMGPGDMGPPFCKRPLNAVDDFAIGSKRARFTDELGPCPMPPRVHTYCDICGTEVMDVPWNQHVRAQEHKWMENQCHKGCDWCEVETFRSYADVIAHRRTPGHLQNKEKFQYQKDQKDTVKYKSVDELPDYNSEKEIGQNYVAFVTGWYCKLCKKFFREESTANGEHCRSKLHYEKWRAARVMGIEDRQKKLSKKQQA
ncbi:uncharacterized protein LOC121382988 [Gigantopelta aegis]|uniref:uncharacterized protein LOC121382988 n=1 Tax=Gigantopelta aegis TaxID=1735272 RepID=UPI001B88AD6D|nr:uncharacterized protein LOC121382988 [Gigantopelta aegis]